MNRIAERAKRDQQEQHLIEVMHDSSKYRDIGRCGEPCPAFPDLTVYSTPDDIRRSVSDGYARSLAMIAQRFPESPVANDPVVREIVEGISAMYARAYVTGLQEGAAGHDEDR